MTIEETPILGDPEKKLRKWLEDSQLQVALDVLRGQITALEVEALESVMNDLEATAGQADPPLKAKELLAKAASLRIAIRELEGLVKQPSFQLVKIVV